MTKKISQIIMVLFALVNIIVGYSILTENMVSGQYTIVAPWFASISAFIISIEGIYILYKVLKNIKNQGIITNAIMTIYAGINLFVAYQIYYQVQGIIVNFVTPQINLYIGAIIVIEGIYLLWEAYIEGKHKYKHRNYIRHINYSR